MSTGPQPGDGGKGGGESPPTTTAAAAPPDAPSVNDEPTADSLQQRVGELETQLATLRESLAASERQSEVYRLLVESGSTDIEAASALVLERLDGVTSPDIADEVRELKRRKPGLFKRSTPASSMGGRDNDPPPSPLDTAATDARGGGRAALLRYMRARRG